MVILNTHNIYFGWEIRKYVFIWHSYLKADLYFIFQSRIYKCTDCLKDDQHSWSVERYDIAMIDDYIEIDLRGQYSLSEIVIVSG